MPDRILLQPAPSELDRFQEHYDALVGDLEREGVLVRVVSTPERHSPGETATGEPYELVIHVGEIAKTRLTYVKLTEIVRRRLKAPPSVERVPPRRCMVYLASGEEREFALDPDDE